MKPKPREFFYRIFLLALVAAIPSANSARADNTAAFDLSGPRVEMRVSRAGRSLPIANVPNFQAGDRLWIHPDLPEDQSVHYLLVVVFLRGSTNPPPENWFTKAETWNKQIREEGLGVTVPDGAQQALLFLAPETSGDFSTLRSAVRSKPGIFVRASQDLNRASLDRSRLEKYLQSVRESSLLDAKEIHERSTMLARTLNIKLDQQCFERPAEQQAPCLMQNSDQRVLDDGHSQSMVAALTSGPSTDLIGAISSTSLAGGGSYSPYVGAVVDLARLLENFRTAEYQYIPALALPKKEQLNLRLNNPPSFRKPKSVLVVGLPAVEAAQLPPLRAVHAAEIFCLQKPGLILPVEGAPLVFSTDIAHDFSLQYKNKSGGVVDLPAFADPARGGFAIDARALPRGEADPEITATLRGYWGFETYTGPNFHLRSARAGNWNLPPAEQSALVVGREDVVHIQSDCVPCVEQLQIKNAQGEELKTSWKLVKPGEVEIQVALKNQVPGELKMSVKQFGLAKNDELSLHSYAEAARLERFSINSGDRQGVLKGTRLDEVNSFELNGVRFLPAKLSRADQKDELRLAVAEGAPAAELAPESKVVAHVALRDGRVLDLQTTVEPPRPKVALVSKTVQPGPTASPVRLGNSDELPQDGKLSFSLKSEVPDKFPRTEKIEVAASDDSFRVLLSVADGNLVMQDSQNLLAVLEPLKNFGPSAFGPVHFRAVDADGAKGDWIPLVNLVRLPGFKEIRCPDSPDKPCRLSGTNLFLLDGVASDAQFTHNVPVAVGFMESTLTVPRPNGTLLYIKLRDDPATVSSVVLPVLPE